MARNYSINPRKMHKILRKSDDLTQSEYSNTFFKNVNFTDSWAFYVIVTHDLQKMAALLIGVID